MRLVETIALDSLRNRRCAHLKLLRAHLNLGLAMLHQIMVPAGMRRRAALRRRDDVAFTMTVVDERRRAQLAAFGPARREEKEVVAKRSDAFSALRVELVNNASVPIRHISTNALEDGAIPLPAAERSASGLITTHYCPRRKPRASKARKSEHASESPGPERRASRARGDTATDGQQFESGRRLQNPLRDAGAVGRSRTGRTRRPFCNHAPPSACGCCPEWLR